MFNYILIPTTGAFVLMLITSFYSYRNMIALNIPKKIARICIFECICCCLLGWIIYFGIAILLFLFVERLYPEFFKNDFNTNILAIAFAAVLLFGLVFTLIKLTDHLINKRIFGRPLLSLKALTSFMPLKPQ